MKTFDEATLTIFPNLEQKTIDEFVLFRGRDLMKELTQNEEMRQVLLRLGSSALSHLMSGCDCDPVKTIIELAKDCAVVGVAIGMEMEKGEPHITKTE